MFLLKDKHIIVIGGSRGIGSACSVMAARAGANVSFTFNSDEDSAKETSKKISDLGAKSISTKADISNEKDMKKAFDKMISTFGIPNGVVISAGLYQEKLDFYEISMQVWERVLSVNLTGTFIAAREAIKYIKEGALAASIVIITSTAGLSGADHRAAYATSKGAQITFMKSIAKELGPLGIRVNCVAPSWTETKMITKIIQEVGVEKLSSGFPLGKINQPEDIAGAVLYLLSDLSSNVTGTTLIVDGGASMI